MVFNVMLQFKNSNYKQKFYFKTNRFGNKARGQGFQNSNVLNITRNFLQLCHSNIFELNEIQK